MIDFHLHTSFSKDSNEKMYDIVSAANQKGLTHIAITDHLDSDDLLAEDWLIEDIDGPEGYVSTIEKMKHKFPEINITRGVEAGYTPSGEKNILKHIDMIKPEFVIGSLHFINGIDVYESRFFDGMTKKQSFNYYFDRLYEAILPLSKYSHVIGHITYISKSPNVPYDDPVVHYAEYQNKVDDILKLIIERGMGIEINTSGLLRKVKLMLPHYEIVKRYRELGGNILTVGSDAHTADNVGYGIQNAYQMAKEADFEYITIFPEGKQTGIKI